MIAWHALAIATVYLRHDSLGIKSGDNPFTRYIIIYCVEDI